MKTKILRMLTVALLALTGSALAVENSVPLRFCLATLEHDHAWWTMDQIRQTPGIELVGVFDRQARLRDKASARLTNTVPLFDDVEKMQQMTVVNGMQGPRDMNVLTPDYKKWLYDPERNGGGVMGDQVTYGLDYILWVMGRPERVVASVTAIKKHEEGVDDLATLTLQYPRGQATVIASWAWPHPRDEILCFGPLGSLSLRGKEVVLKNSPTRFTVSVEEKTSQSAATVPPERKHGIAYFAHVLRNHLPIETPHSAELNMGVCEVVDAARESARSGKAVVLPPKE